VSRRLRARFYQDGTFQPQQLVTRAEFATMLRQAFDLEPGETSFDDIDGHWASEAISAAASAGFLSGYPDGGFRPSSKITRQETIFSLSPELTEESDLDIEQQLQDFADAGSIADWARKPIARANKAGLLENDQVVAGRSSESARES
jgi:hypothetical protein